MNFWKNERRVGEYYIYFSLFLLSFAIAGLLLFAFWVLEIHHRGWKKIKATVKNINGECSEYKIKGFNNYYSCPVMLNYSVNGKEYNTLTTISRTFKPKVGDVGFIYYNPKNPNDIDPNEIILEMWGKLFLYIGIVKSVIFSLMYAFRNNKYFQIIMGFIGASVIFRAVLNELEILL